MKTQYYHILDDKGRYYCYNDFNGKAAMLAPEKDGTPPSIAKVMEKGEAERKIKYLMDHTNNDTNTPEGKKTYSHNHFSSLTLKEII